MNRVFQHDLFSDRTVPQVQTESIKYIGSKLKIIPYILEMAMRIGARSVFDGFTGSTRVAQAFAQAGCDVVAADISMWSQALAACYLRKERGEYIKEILAELNNAEPFDGWFTEKYGGEAQRPVVNGYKNPWQKHNTRKLDAIRERISQMNLSPAEEATALTSLMLALDRVDNTLGHFASYLKEWSPRSFNHLVLKEPLFIPTPGSHRVEQGDIFKVIEDMPEADLAYLDPPYGSNNEKMPPSRVRYASYYHIWTTVCLNDRPEVFGKARRRADTATAWFAFTDSTIQAGCMRFIPGSHRCGPIDHDETFDADNLLMRGQTIRGVDESKAIDIELAAGEISIHHESVVHGSNPNESGDARIGLSIHYVAPHIRQTAFAGATAQLVRGRDTNGHWLRDPEPKRHLDPDCLAALDAAYRQYRSGIGKR